MTNKEYKKAKEIAENVNELYTFMKYDGHRFFPTFYVDSDAAKELRATYKQDKASRNAFVLDGFNGRAVIIPIDNGLVLKSYYTPVVALYDGVFYRLWNGFSATTLKHVNILRKNGGMPPLSKREWIEMPVAEYVGDNEYASPYTGEIFTAI